jgi:hypothetical protein
LLASKRTHDEFNRLYRWHDGNAPIDAVDELSIYPNPFAQHLDAGRLIPSIKIVKGGDTHDQMLVFTFGPPDAAASVFR